MEIGIIGAGSIGLLFAAYLNKTSDVTVYTRTVDQAEIINEKGVVLLKKDSEYRYQIKARQADLWNGKENFTIIAVKQHQLEVLIDKAVQINLEKCNILFLQNGMSHLKQLPRLEKNNLFVGSVEQGAYKENSNTVRHNGEGVTNLALFSGDRASLKSFSSLVPSDFPISLHENYYEMLLSKLIINAVINPLTAILQVQNGVLLKNDYYYTVLKDMFNEVSFILDLSEAQFYLDKVIDVCKKTAPNRSSMLKDIEAGRKTEIDAILGFLLEEADKKKKAAPLIKSMYLLVKGMENS